MKKTEVKDVCVIVHSRKDFNGDRAIAMLVEDCERIAGEIRRHCDDASVYVSQKTVEVCSFCHSQWELDPENGEPMCCQQAVTEFQQLRELKV